eukprot:3122809-Rhodomonas_salina.2
MELCACVRACACFYCAPCILALGGGPGHRAGRHLGAASRGAEAGSLQADTPEKTVHHEVRHG